MSELDSLFAFLDRAHLIAWRWVEQRTLRRLRRRYPVEFRDVPRGSWRDEMDDAYDKLVTARRPS